MFVVFEAVREVVDGGEELGDATAALSEAMLCIVQNVMLQYSDRGPVGSDAH